MPALNSSGIFIATPLEYKFPRDPTTKGKWIDATGRINWFPCKSSTICSQHFVEDDIVIKKSGNRYIKDKAIPRKNILVRHLMINDSHNESETASSSNIILVVKNTSPRRRKIFSYPFHQRLVGLKNEKLGVDKLSKQKLVQAITLKDRKIQQQKLKINALQVKNRILGKLNVNLRKKLKSIEEKVIVKEEKLGNLENTNTAVIKCEYVVMYSDV